MLVLITYDVNTEGAAGRKRLRQIARQCVNYGQRVQNSVFECLLDPAQCRLLQAKLLSIIDLERDSLNDVMDNVADTAADLGRQVMDELRTQSRHMADRAEEAERQVRQEKSDLEREAAELERRVEEDLLGGGKRE